LSGFLITSLLLIEKDQAKEVSVRPFYQRRAGRILPLYFTVMVIGFFLVPFIAYKSSSSGNIGQALTASAQNLNQHWWKCLGLFLVLCSNIALLIASPVMGAAQAWSLGYEEHFYLIWPWLIRLKRQKILIFLGGAFVFSVFVLFDFFESNLFSSTLIYIYFKKFHLEYIIVGSTGAFSFKYGTKSITNIAKAIVSLNMALPILILTLMFGRSEGVVSLICCGSYTLIIFGLARSNVRLSFFENPIIRWLGKISYGLYMYHPIAIILTLVVFERLGFSKSRFGYLFLEVILYSIILGLTIFIASISSKTIERIFLVRNHV
jgi:peptidoglycan/LPS O-acetylase OafA/YrhL